MWFFAFCFLNSPYIIKKTNLVSPPECGRSSELAWGLRQLGVISRMQASLSAHIYKQISDEDQSQFSDRGCFVQRENKTKDKSTLLIPKSRVSPHQPLLLSLIHHDVCEPTRQNVREPSSQLRNSYRDEQEKYPRNTSTKSHHHLQMHVFSFRNGKNYQCPLFYESNQKMTEPTLSCDLLSTSKSTSQLD